MLHRIEPLPQCLSDAERKTLRAVAEAAIPRGKWLPGAGERTTRRLEAFIAEAPPHVRDAWRLLLRLVDAAAIARYLRPMASLDTERRVAIMESFRTGDY